MGLGLQVLVPLPLLAGLLEPPHISWGAGWASKGGATSAFAGVGPPGCALVGILRGDPPGGRWVPASSVPTSQGWPGRRRRKGLRSHGQVDQNPEQLPVQTRCLGIKVPLCWNN